MGLESVPRIRVGSQAGSLVVWMSTAMITMTPPTNAAEDGLSDSAIQTQSGPRTISSSVIKATSAAGMSLAPMVRKNRPSAIWPAPSSTRNTRSRFPTLAGSANGAKTGEQETATGRLRAASRPAPMTRDDDRRCERDRHDERHRESHHAPGPRPADHHGNADERDRHSHPRTPRNGLAQRDPGKNRRRDGR